MLEFCASSWNVLAKGPSIRKQSCLEWDSSLQPSSLGSGCADKDKIRTCRISTNL